jgi:hypothetical protein
MSLAVHIDGWFWSLRAESHLLTIIFYTTLFSFIAFFYTPALVAGLTELPALFCLYRRTWFNRTAAYQQPYKSRLSLYLNLSLKKCLLPTTPHPTCMKNPSINLPQWELPIYRFARALMSRCLPPGVPYGTLRDPGRVVLRYQKNPTT